MKSFLWTAVAVTCLFAAAHAQLPISLKGIVEALPAAGCDTQATHRLRCTDVQLKSATVDLVGLQGRTVDIEGVLDLLQPGCISVDVTSAASATSRTSQLAIFGTRLGRPVVFTSFTPIGSTIFYVWSCGPGFLPLGPLGTVLIDVREAILVGTNLSIGIDLRTETIPNDPTLVGVSVHYQFGYLALLTGFEVGFLNPGCFTIQQ